MTSNNNKLQRFMNKVVKEENGCWGWDSTYRSQGYPLFYWGVENGKEVTKKASRAAYILMKGDIPNGMHVCHSCDNRGCVNPDHLWLGTHQDNMNDRNIKGRTSKGAHRYNYKRTQELVSKIKKLRSEGFKIKEVCNELDIGWNTYFRAMRGGDNACP